MKNQLRAALLAVDAAAQGNAVRLDYAGIMQTVCFAFDFGSGIETELVALQFPILDL